MQIKPLMQEITAMPAPLLSRPSVLSSDHNKMGRFIIHHTLIKEDMLFSTLLEDVLNSHYGLLCSSDDEIQSANHFVQIEDSQLINIHTVHKYII